MENFKATSELKDTTGRVIGFNLVGTDGNTLSIKSEAVESAIKDCKVCIDNLEYVGGKLRMKISEQQRSLTAELKKANDAYEKGEEELISNHEYDAKFDELQRLEHESGVVLDDSPTINVGADVSDSKLPKYTFKTPMKSLAKTKSIEELLEFLGGRQAVVSTKMDGLTVVLEYDNGLLERAVTRGNGTVGEVVTNNAKVFMNIPTKISYGARLVLRGEAIMKYSDFEKINEQSGGKYKNPRNLCSGSVRQLDANVTRGRNIYWYGFEVVESSEVFENYDEQLDFLAELGFECVEYMVCRASDLESTIRTMTERVKKADIPADGLVVKHRDIEYGMSLGSTAKSPRHSMAFKWEDEEAVTELTGITWQVGRSGVITPVAEFKPVDIEGSTIRRATLHNLSIMIELIERPYVGQKIGVYKANMIIPNVAWGDRETTVPEDKIITIPGTCPCCGATTIVREESSSGVLTLWCDNDSCGAKGDKLLEHFVSRDAMNIEGISGSRLSDFEEMGLISDFASVFELGDYEDIITEMPGYGVKSFDNIVNALEKARNVKLSNLIYALGIPNIGLETSKTICKHFGYDLKKTVTAGYYDLAAIHSIGDVIATSFVNYFDDAENQKEFERLVSKLNIIPEEVSTDTRMAGMTFCVTGDVYIFKNRRAIKELIEGRGGKLTGSVSRSTNYLITNDTESGSNKNKAARSYGVPILTEEQFIKEFDIEV